MKSYSYLHKFCPVAAAWLCVYPQVPFLMGFCNFLTQKAQQSPRSLGELTGIGLHTATVDLQGEERIRKVCSLPIPGSAQGLGGWGSKPGIVEGSIPHGRGWNKWALGPLPAQTTIRFPTHQVRSACAQEQSRFWKGQLWACTPQVTHLAPQISLFILPVIQKTSPAHKNCQSTAWASQFYFWLKNLFLVDKIHEVIL